MVMPRDKSSLALLCRRAAVRTIGRSKELVAEDNIVGYFFLWDRHDGRWTTGNRTAGIGVRLAVRSGQKVGLRARFSGSLTA
jgi:hypothetical protein